jgi:Zn finger protein HypA/HybF involved in hydrogenase expression
MSDMFDLYFYVTCSCGFGFYPYSEFSGCYTIEQIFTQIQNSYACPHCGSQGQWSHNF